jgi:hypothetical protein
LKTNSSHPERSEGSPILLQILRFAQNDYGRFWHVFNRALEALKMIRLEKARFAGILNLDAGMISFIFIAAP